VRRDDVILLCPPVGWQHVGMGQMLYEQNACFRAALDECATLAEDHNLLPAPLLDVLYPPECDAAAAAAASELLQTPTFTMPALFAVEYALLRLCEEGGDGLAPYAVVGHSIGEYVAAVVSGVLDLPTAMRLVCERGVAMDDNPLEGSMISVVADAPTVLAAIETAGVAGEVSIAAINGPSSIVLGGADTQLRLALDALPPRTKSRRVATTHPDHTRLMAPIAEAVGRRAETLLAAQPALPPPDCLWSSTVAGWAAATPLGSADYWREGVVAGVDFPRAVERVVRDYAERARDEDAESGSTPFPRRKLRFVELGEGMLTRFCRDVPCLTSLEFYDGLGLDFETELTHLLPRKAAADRAGQAREIEGVVAALLDECQQAAAVPRGVEVLLRGHVLG